MATALPATYPLHPQLKPVFPAQQLASAEERIAAEGPNALQLFTDGSTLNRTENTEAEMVVFRGNTLIHFWHVPTGTFSSSFQAEKTVLIAAISWLEQNDDWFSASIITDCKSLLQTLSNPNITDPFLLFLNLSIAAFYQTESIRLTWVPGYSSLPSNNLADEQT